MKYKYVFIIAFIVNLIASHCRYNDLVTRLMIGALIITTVYIIKHYMMRRES